MRYPQHLSVDYFKEKIYAPAYYWVNIWVQNRVYRDTIKKRFGRDHIDSLEFNFTPVSWEMMQPQRTVRESTIWNINFIRKERVYTKLKYSRTPSYDIASAGVAALFAGFLGFLICEKFGFEMVDGGDFLFLLLYIAILSMFIKLFGRVYTGDIRSFMRVIFRAIHVWIRWILAIPLLLVHAVLMHPLDDDDDI